MKDKIKFFIEELKEYFLEQKEEKKLNSEIFGSLLVVLGTGLGIYAILSSFEAIIPLGKVGLKIMPIAVILFLIGLFELRFFFIKKRN
jgi:uncharacterized membrane-anchored protein